jgi:hypothetical protein
VALDWVADEEPAWDEDVWTIDDEEAVAVDDCIGRGRGRGRGAIFDACWRRREI